MKKLILSLAVVGLLSASCDKDDNNTPYVPVNNTPAGAADLTLTTGTEEIKIVGPCGWSTAGGVHYIGANDSNISTKAFEMEFDIDQLPTTTTTYTLTEYDLNDVDPGNVHMSFNVGATDHFDWWETTDTSGSVTLVVDGNKVTVTLVDIPLDFGHTGPSPHSQDGTLSGTVVLYRS